MVSLGFVAGSRGWLTAAEVLAQRRRWRKKRPARIRRGSSKASCSGVFHKKKIVVFYTVDQREGKETQKTEEMNEVNQRRRFGLYEANE